MGYWKEHSISPRREMVESLVALTWAAIGTLIIIGMTLLANGLLWLDSYFGGNVI